MKNIFQGLFEFDEVEVENWHILWQQNLFLKTFLKFLFLITSKQYNTLEKVKKNIIRIAIANAIKSWPELN